MEGKSGEEAKIYKGGGKIECGRPQALGCALMDAVSDRSKAQKECVRHWQRWACPVKLTAAARLTVLFFSVTNSSGF